MNFTDHALTRRQLLARTAASTLALSPALSRADTWPNKPLRLVVPFAPGGSSEIVARALAGELAKTIGQNVFVDNKPGGAGNIAMQEVANSTDEHTLVLGHIGTLAVNPYIFPKLSYDVNKDFTPITLISKVPSLYVVHPDLPVKNLKEFVAYAKANPGKLAFGHGSSGSLVSAAMLTELAGLQTVNVPYKSIPPALTDLLGGQIQFAFADTGNAVSQMNGGRMRGLGVTTKKRAGKAPNVPPIGETVKDYNVSAWFGLMAPAGMPADVQKKATATLMAVLAKPDVREKIQGVGIDLDVEDSATLAKTIDAEIKKWGGWVKTAGITPE